MRRRNCRLLLWLTRSRARILSLRSSHGRVTSAGSVGRSLRLKANTRAEVRISFGPLDSTLPLGPIHGGRAAGRYPTSNQNTRALKMSHEHEGGCLCGAVRYRIKDQPYLAGFVIVLSARNALEVRLALQPTLMH